MNSAHRRGKVTFFVPKKVSRWCTKDFFVRFVDSILIRDELSYISQVYIEGRKVSCIQLQAKISFGHAELYILLMQSCKRTEFRRDESDFCVCVFTNFCVCPSSGAVPTFIVSKYT